MQFNKYLQVIVWLLCVLSLSQTVWAFRIEEKTLYPKVELRAQVISKEATGIVNRIRYPTPLTIIPDGATVKKGQELIHFDQKSILLEVEEYQHELKTVTLELKQQALRTERVLNSLNDDLMARKSALAVLQAKRARLTILPYPEDVESAQGEFSIAELNLEVAANELVKSKRRFEKKMIAATQLEDSEMDVLREEVRLEYAKKNLNWVSRPTKSIILKINALHIANAKLEVDKLEKELIKKKEIATIQEATARSIKKIATHKLKKKQEELDYIVLKAPVSGVIRYSPRFIRDRMEGRKPRANSTIMEIPDLSNLQLKAYIPEHYGAYFKGEDSALISFPHLGKRKIKGKLATISNNPVDMSELFENVTQGKTSGIKFFECTITINADVPGIKVGMSAHTELQAQTPVKGPAIPLQWVYLKDAIQYLPYKGKLQKVDGAVFDDLLFLSDSTWLDNEIQSISQHRLNVVNRSQQNTHLTLFGELAPTEAIDISIPRTRQYYRSIKSIEIAEEFKQIEKGEVILKLYSEYASKRIDEQKGDVEKAKGALEKFLKEVELNVQEKEHQKSIIINNLSIAKLEKESVDKDIDIPSQLLATRNLSLAQLDLTTSQKKLARTEKKKELYSERKLSTLRRICEENVLKLELAQIQLKKVEEGSTSLERMQVALKVKVLENEWEKLMNRIQYDEQEIKGTIDIYKRRLVKEESRLRYLNRDMELFTIRAPTPGVLRYNKVYDGLSHSKFRTNLEVYPSQKVMSLINTSSMLLKVEVPERYYGKIKNDMQVHVNIPAMDLENIPARVESIHSVFRMKKRNQAENTSLYTEQEELGYNVFEARIVIDALGVPFKSGALTQVVFPITAF
ncbi:MAG: HlyD family efflux transporter periplasmic adaptor subunit [Planctomycetes bacterium]|nr:HlyD family efflux transporter periplasmic adaptor subunit [Planctomycetota bacterium]